MRHPLKWHAKSWGVSVLIGLMIISFFALESSIHNRLGSVTYAQGLTPPLANPGLERPYTPRGGASEVEVAEYWEPWWREGGEYHRPEFKPMEDPARVYEGTTSQKTFTVYAKHHGGLYQIVTGLTEGNWYRFSCHVYTLTDEGKSFSVVGVNPWGDAWPEHWTTNWGKPAYNTFNRWEEVDVLFQAWSPKAALFTMGDGEWAVRYQDWYWDACKLVSAASPVQPTPTPQPTPPTPQPCDCPSLEDIADTVQWIVDRRAPVLWPRE